MFFLYCSRTSGRDVEDAVLKFKLRVMDHFLPEDFWCSLCRLELQHGVENVLRWELGHGYE
jgi:hypothetical protein